MSREYTHTNTEDELGNEADFFVKVGDVGSGWTPSDRAITLIIISEDLKGKHTFYTSEDYRKFLDRLDMSYLFEKYGLKQIIDSEKFIEENIKKVIEDRKSRDLSLDDARELYRFLKNDCAGLKNENELYFLLKENVSCLHELDEYFYIYTKWTDRQIAFYEKLWKMFIESIQAVIIKCISCGAIESSNKKVCNNCGSSDIYASVIGQSARISCLSSDDNLMQWCEDNSYNTTISSIDNHSLLVWDKNCPYPIHITDLE